MVFVKGQSGNPGGRCSGAAVMARLIRKETRDGAELVDYALHVYRNSSDDKNVQWAHAWLSDRGFGKAIQSVDIELAGQLGDAATPANVGLLTLDQRKSMLEALQVLRLATVTSEDDATEH